MSEDPGEPVLYQPAFYVVCVVHMDRAYGGPEEGGWWYDTTEPVVGPDIPLPSVWRTMDEAQAACDALSDWCVEHNEGRREIGSVLSEGRYGTMIYEGQFPHPTPEERPHYE